MNTQENIPLEFICTDPELREQYFDDYFEGVLQGSQKRKFEIHLRFCRKCQEDIEYMRWVSQKLKLYKPPGEVEEPPSQSDFFFQKYGRRFLPITSITTLNSLNLTDYYHERPAEEELAASADTPDELALEFPITMEYANGNIIGEFRERAGLLFYRLTKSTVDRETFRCTLRYTPAVQPSEEQTYDLCEGEDKELGTLHDFIPADTIQGIVNALQQFQLRIKREEPA